ncbi:bifunctional periplasmic peptidase (C14 family)/ peptidyl-prolyl cis-trans isomerase (Cyclophilin family) [Sulfurimonas gotlandica GD1]|uniref:Bifunctional periplasmic peptidase (C14 family)/ peptidyl-prolyl cis-trans isomerase (Cyclophilin family) n=1 Tax=Sulfurimonas gotlandica (strain DSM 19862 / JCM 16533 / GD1) TaxID=929558 RepID=B6BIP3_SULGG|nr:peptidylprolyl isomerase [Sulfurimonas gotlandica]EDZ63604.1 peptidylprolyl isomerase [Sulfurimonas gotlandica GD1]EHP30401.1 bifunctional periplasmic peptidase (C14 family)/ peptidyl-prolyl cis-trans isomerase (Cyclophilin family) [Sulfurimonas gotlandica GD1]
MIKRFILLLLIPLTIFAAKDIDRSFKMMKIEQRVALVIGNNQYDSNRLGKLQNPINDSRAMKDKLKDLGFKVYYGENLTVREMRKKLRDFGEELQKGGVGLFFFAGHGIESQGQNYLIGKDSNLISEDEIEDETLELSRVINKMNKSGNRLNIVLLDACRNNPFSRSSGGGLAKVQNAKGMFIAYATSPGEVASDGNKNNGVFTEQIIKHIDTEGIPIGRMFKRVKKDVYEKTNQKQRPWTHDDIIGDFYFKLPTKSDDKFAALEKSLIAPIKLDSYTEKAASESNTIVLETTQGKIEIDLYPDIAPLAVENFKTHIKNGYYNGIAFHRIIKNFMIQGGDPTESGRGGKSIWDKSFKDEYKNKTFDKAGILAMANAGPHTNGSQFFITTAKTPWLNGRHTIFGQVKESSMETIMKLNNVDTFGRSGADRPQDRQEIIKAYIK